MCCAQTAIVKGVVMVDQKHLESQGCWHSAFCVFIPMAFRRLKGDVLPRRYPELRPAMCGVRHAFGPWVTGAS